MTQTIQPKPRISSIDALRGFSLIGIVLLHCMEHFDLTSYPEYASALMQKIDMGVYDVIRFFVQGKSYAIFSMLFGLSFFIQMDNQADKGVDFRLRFLWRMALLLVLGYVNGLMYMGEFFVVYAILGCVMVLLWRVPTKVLLVLALLLFLQIPEWVSLGKVLVGGAPNERSEMAKYMSSLYVECADVFTNGTFWDMIKFNLWKGQLAKCLWVVAVARYLQLIGLFIIGLLIGRAGIHRSEESLVKWSRRALPWALGVFAVFYGASLLLPAFGLEGFALRQSRMLLRNYANLGQMIFYVAGLTLLYYKSKGWRSVLDKLAPVGRMSVTNYMMQSVFGVFIFYGFGLNLASATFSECAVAGVVICAVQILFSNWWMKHHYYGPVEWLWRTATWMKRVPLKR
ncbi:MAG: DUF418 domain-containing protein [Alistipes sp.]|nr:DUF418 domain-containing protein [Alistipes sp.]